MNLGIANTMDLPEKLLPRISSRMGIQRLCFGPYNYQQLQEIISSRLNGIDVFEKQAIEFASRKVSLYAFVKLNVLNINVLHCDLIAWETSPPWKYEILICNFLWILDFPISWTIHGSGKRSFIHPLGNNIWCFGSLVHFQIVMCIQVAAISGDARRALEICRRAAEIADYRIKKLHSNSELAAAGM